MSDAKFLVDFNSTVDKITTKYDTFLLLGDLNFDMLDDTKNVPLENMKDVFDLTNMVKKPTCHTNIGKPSLVDVILTNKPSACGKICNFPCGISDVHNCISVQLDISVKSSDTRWRNCRSFKNYNHEDFISDLQEIVIILSLQREM